MNEAMKQALEFFESGNFVYPTKIATDLRQAIAELESQEPVAWVDLQKEAQQIVESKFLWKKFIDGTPLANDIACWMADFALQHTHPPQRTEQEPVGEVGWLADVPNTIREVCWKKGSPPIGTKLYTHPPQRTEPVDYEKLAALGWQAIECGICGGGAMGYPQRTWVGLTDYEIGVCSTEAAMNRSEMVGGAVTFARAIEAKLKEKNND